MTLSCAGAFAVTHGSNEPSRPAVQFPSREQVEQIRGKKAHIEAFRADEVAVDTWTFESLAAGDEAPYDDPSPWGDLMRDLARAHPTAVALSAPLRCAAQEMARFALKNHAPPAESLRRFMLARCGVAQVHVAPSSSLTPVPSSVSDQELVAHARAMVERVLLGQGGDQTAEKARGKTGAGGRRQVALAVVRDTQNAALVAISAADDVRLQPGSLSVDEHRRVVLRGAVDGNFSEIRALVNRGEQGAAPCESDETVAPPQFSVACELAAGDRFAWVQVAGQRRGHFLMEEVAHALVYESDGKDIEYAVRHSGPPANVTGAADFPGKMLERLNGVRRSAKLPPLALATQQTAENARLAGTLIDAAFDPDDLSDQAAVGLLAGWDVEGLIRTGHTFLSVAPSLDASAWLDAALETPMGRTALLDPDARQIAVGAETAANREGRSAIGAVVTTYSFFESDDHALDADRFFARIAAARAQRGLPAPQRIPVVEPMPAEIARVRRGTKPPSAALDGMLEGAVQHFGIAARGYVLEASDLERTPVPDALLGRGPLRMILAVTHHRAPNAAWGQYVVFAIVLGGGGGGEEA
jgi:hypothetical protein